MTMGRRVPQAAPIALGSASAVLVSVRGEKGRTCSCCVGRGLQAPNQLLGQGATVCRDSIFKTRVARQRAVLEALRVRPVHSDLASAERLRLADQSDVQGKGLGD